MGCVIGGGGKYGQAESGQSNNLLAIKAKIAQGVHVETLVEGISIKYLKRSPYLAQSEGKP